MYLVMKYIIKSILHKWILPLVLVFISSHSFAQTDVNTRYILFDVTGSMIGKGYDAKGLKNKDVWDKAIKEIQIKLSTFDQNDNVILYFFGSELKKIKEYKLDKQKSQINEIINEINKVKSTGDFHECTCTYTAFNEVFNQLNKKTTNTIWVFTDGIPTPDCGHCKGMMSKKEISEKLGAGYKEDFFDYLYIYELKPIEDLLDTEEIPEEAFDQEESNDVPTSIDISDIVVDFRMGWEYTKEIAIHENSKLNGRTAKFELTVNNEKIQLESKDIKIENDRIKLKFSLEEGYYGFKDTEIRGKLNVVGKNSEFFNKDISIVFKMPLKGKISIKID